MIKLKAVNKYRRKFTQRITKGLSGTHKNKVFNATELPDLKKILLCRPNHRLGNLVLIAPIIQDVAANFPNCKIDLFIKGGLGPVVFKNYTNIETFIELPKKPFKQLLKYVRTWFLIRKKRYDLVINVTSTSSSGRLATKFSKSTFKLFGDENDDQFKNIKDFLHIAKNPVYNFRHCMTALGYDINDNGIPGLDIKLSKTEIKEGQKLLNELVSNKKDTICIFTFATGQKCYDESWWMSFYKQLKKEFKNYNIVEVLPVENISQIGFIAPSFYSKDIREICAFISNTSIFIGSDSGIMHLASASFTPTIGLFSVTNENIYHPYNNSSMSFNTAKKPIDHCFKELNKILPHI